MTNNVTCSLSRRLEKLRRNGNWCDLFFLSNRVSWVAQCTAQKLTIPPLSQNAFSNFGGDSGYHVVIRFVTSDWIVTSLGKWFWVCLKNPSRSLLPPRRRAPVRNKPAESLRDRPQAFARGKQERPALRRKLFVRCESGFLFVLEPERKLVRVKRR